MSQTGGTPRRIVIFGVTGQIGQEVVDRLDEAEWPIAELVGVASTESLGATFGFGGMELDVLGEWPALKGFDLVILCTRGASALEIVRECLHAQVPCLDLTGALSNQGSESGVDVPMPFLFFEEQGEGGSGRVSPEDRMGIEKAPLVATPSPTALAWARALAAIAPPAEGDLKRVVGTVLASASGHGRGGVVALSEESIALFNQSKDPDPGPAGQPVAFDVVPAAEFEVERVRAELARALGSSVGFSVSALQVPTFVGEGGALAVELAKPLTREDVETRLDRAGGVSRVGEGIGSRGLAAVEEDAAEPSGPTLRDAAGRDEVLVGRIEADPSLADGCGWRLWLSFDPIGLTAAHALRVAEVRLGLR